GAMAEASRHRLLQLSRGADKCSEAGRVPFPCHPSLVAHAAAAKPERLDDDGTDRAVGRGLAPETAHPPSLARFAVRHPRWDPYARIGHIRILAGGAGQLASLPRSGCARSSLSHHAQPDL